MSDQWTLTYRSFIPERQALRETLCTLGNGYFATRGAAAEANAGEIHYPGTYLAGCYNRLKTEVAGQLIENEDLVNCPNWLPIRFRIDEGEWFHLSAVEILSFEQQLHMREGLLTRQVLFRATGNRECLLKEKRLVHMGLPHLAAIEWQLTPLNWSGEVTIHTALDGTVINHGVERYRKLNSHHLTPLETAISEDEQILSLTVETNQSNLQLSQAARIKFFQGDALIIADRCGIQKKGYVAQEVTLPAKKGERIALEKVVAFYSGRDHAISEPALDACQAVECAPSFDSLVLSQKNAWHTLWNAFDIELETEEGSGMDDALMVLRLHLFHLLQTASPNSLDLDVGVPARGWHGEAYRGHIFWDELFIFPTYNLRMPKITASLLKYRIRRLQEARKAAKELGFQGAMYPWQSGSNGREESQKLHLNPKSGRWIEDNSSIQRHVNAAIAYNIWRYWEVTGDLEFLLCYGSETFLEIARFWASVTQYNPQLDRYEILGVMGPDEYHDAYPHQESAGLNNNAYTNVMAAWIFSRALELLQLLPIPQCEELRNLLSLKDEEIHLWEKMSRKMRVVFHGEEGIISQFEGFEKLREFPWKKYREKYGNIHRLDRILEAEGESCNRYQVSKQADLLMLFYIFSKEELKAIFNQLGYNFSAETISQNIDYYLKRTSHGSTLSSVVHSWVLAREDRTASWQLFIEALKSDVADVQGGTTKEGIHLGAMAGTVDLVQRCYAGIEVRNGILHFNPCLPSAIRRLKLHLYFRGHALEVEISHEQLKVRSRYTTAKEIEIGYQGQRHLFSAGDERLFSLKTTQTIS